MNTTIITIDTPGFMVGLSYEKKINLLNLARTESYKWIYVGSSPNLAFTFRGDESQSLNEKIQQTKMLVTCQRFGDLFLFGLVWQHSSVRTKYNKGRFKVILAAVI